MLENNENQNLENQEPIQFSDKKYVKPAGKAISTVYEGASVFISAVVIILILFTFIFRFVGVSGKSMMPTLHNGDWIIISQYTSKAKDGDIIVSTQPNKYDENIVKRVVATGGQTIDIDFNLGKVFVDGEIIDEPYINNSTTNKYDVDFPVTVPKGYVFVMGDNRQHSTDSRSTEIGLIREEYLLGKAVYNVRASGGFVNLNK